MADFFILPISDPMTAASHPILPAHPVPGGARTQALPLATLPARRVFSTPAVALHCELDWTGVQALKGQEL